ncbi:MAG TPA: redoxin domain-containing protein [Gemmatimonas sp.]|nr:redoxin domain-containing protein [Gemmatimonas sp.]
MSPTKRFTTKRILLGIVVVGVIAAVPTALDAYDNIFNNKGPTPTELEAAAPKTGQPAPAFTAVDTRGAAHSLDAHRGQWVVLEWVNHGCPYTKKHYKSIDGGLGNTQMMQRDYAKRVVWLSVVSSAPGRQGYSSAEEADELTTEKGAVPAGLIRDTAGTLGRLYGARTTPQYAIIDPQGVLRYAGAVDDKQSSSVKDIATATNYVRAALDAGLSGKPIAVAQTQPYGCDVKY